MTWAPVARRVTDRQEDRLVLAARARFERLVAPGIPVHGVPGVLLQVRAGLTGQTIAQIAHTQRVATSYAAEDSVTAHKHGTQRLRLAR